jgi:hypothetical protein
MKSYRAEWEAKCSIIWLGGEAERVADYVVDFSVFCSWSARTSCPLREE